MPGKAFYVTTPIYYVNDAPHIGTAYTTVLADVIARYRRALGDDVWFLTGTDEHGQKAAEAAEKRGLTPRAHCDELSQRFRDTWAPLQISYDVFIRTTEPRHLRVVQAVLDDLWKRGEIYRGTYEGWYHVSDEIFVTEKEIEEKAIDRSKLRRISEDNYFFRMGRQRDAIREAVVSGRLEIRPASRRNEVLGFLEKDLGDLCISRPKSRLSWGVELPFDRDYVTYVWFDALLNYVTGAGYLQDDATFARTWPADVHLMGKDILTTHSVYWPAMLLAAGIPLPRRILAHGWWLVGGTKMSKSIGNVVDPLSYATKFGVDALRWYLVREMVVGQDAEFSDERFRARYDGDLGNEWGNLLSRAVNMIGRFGGGKVPSPALEHGGPSEPRTAAAALLDTLPGLVDDVALHRVGEAAMDLLRAGNRHVDLTQPWKAAKDPAKGSVVADALYTIAETVRVASEVLRPILPTKATDALAQLGVTPSGDLRAALRWGGLVPGTAVVPGPVLFPRVDPPAR
ncbi:MAG: methionine--tRNA ligase [Planctomycetes bacterium]|nr:methionine--tRNA ligase [Planctomycetota bacterium]